MAPLVVEQHQRQQNLHQSSVSVVQQLLLLLLLLSSQLQASTSPVLLHNLQPSTSVHSSNSNQQHQPAIPLAQHLQQQPQPLELQQQPLEHPQQRLQHLELFNLHLSSNSSRPSALVQEVKIGFQEPGALQQPGELGSDWKIEITLHPTCADVCVRCPISVELMVV